MAKVQVEIDPKKIDEIARNALKEKDKEIKKLEGKVSRQQKKINQLETDIKGAKAVLEIAYSFSHELAEITNLYEEWSGYA